MPPRALSIPEFREIIVRYQKGYNAENAIKERNATLNMEKILCPVVLR
jgi:hypothetical protein